MSTPPSTTYPVKMNIYTYTHARCTHARHCYTHHLLLQGSPPKKATLHPEHNHHSPDSQQKRLHDKMAAFHQGGRSTSVYKDSFDSPFSHPSRISTHILKDIVPSRINSFFAYFLLQLSKVPRPPFHHIKLLTTQPKHAFSHPLHSRRSSCHRHCQPDSRSSSSSSSTPDGSQQA